MAQGSSNGQSSQTVEAAHAALQADKSIQHSHALEILRDKKPPAWLDWLIEFFRVIAPVANFLFWIGLALLVGLLIYFIVTEIVGIRPFDRKAKPKADEPLPAWTPQAKEARDLLSAADALAAQGKFGEAVHLILLRSIEQIDRFRPMAVRPAFTSRDIGALPVLPEVARPIFFKIADAVERTLFAGQSIDQSEFEGCRDAYARFALPDGWRS